MKKIDLSIVIPSHNTKDLLKDCLASMYRTESDLSSVEVIVVDNASTDGSIEMVSRDFPEINLIRNRLNQGFAKAANQGWRRSKGNLIVFLNSDTFVKGKNTFEAVKKYFRINKRVGAMSGRLVLRNGEVDLDTHRGFPTPWSSFTFFFGLEKLFPKSKIFARYHLGWYDLNTIHEIDSGCGAFLVVRRKILLDLNGWDENYFFYGEDIDLCYRIKRAGWKIVYFPKIEALHYKGASSGLRRETKDIARTKKDVLIKVAKASVEAWERFYKKFYQGKYSPLVTYLVLLGIRLKGFVRICRFRFKVEKP